MDYRIKRFIRKWLPVALMATLVFGAYHYFTTSPRNRWKLPRSMSQTLTKVPILGTYFKKHRSYKGHRYSHRSQKYRKAKRGKKSYAYKKRSKRSQKRAHRRGRRNRRR